MENNTNNKKPHVLIAEDDMMLRILIRKSLEQAGFEVIEAEDGQEAVELFKAAQPDIILLDVMMPKLDGYEACKKIRQLPHGQQIPIIIVTGLDDIDSISRAYNIGATDFITKPINWIVLIERVRYTLYANEAFTKLRRNEERLSAAQRIAQLGSWTWDLKSGRIDFSEEGSRILQLPEGVTSLMYQDYILRVPEKDAHRVKSLFKKTIFEKKSGSLDHHLLLPDNQEIIVQQQTNIDAQQPDQILGTLQNITRRKQEEKILRKAKEEAEIASRTKSEFLANISHELRTPLNAIIGFSNIMLQTDYSEKSASKHQEYTQDILDSGNHLLSVINDILDLSKIEAGKFELHEHEVDIIRVIETSNRIINERAQSNQIEIITKIDKDIPGILADERALKQVLLNLLSNSIKFTEPGGSITISTYQSDNDNIIIGVKDTGVGMKKEDIPKAMAAFQQVDSSLSRKYEGTGLGLPLSKTLIELHGGTFRIDSEEGVGTEIILELPASRILQD